MVNRLSAQAVGESARLGSHSWKKSTNQRYLTIAMPQPTTEDIVALPSDQMMQNMGLLLCTLITGILLAVGTSSLFLLSSREEKRSLLRRNRFLRAYIVIILSTVLVLNAAVFDTVNEPIIGFKFFSQSQNTYQKFVVIWNKISGSSIVAIVLSADGVLVSVPVIFLKNLELSTASRYGGVLWFKRPLGLTSHPSGAMCFGSFLSVCGS